MKISLEFCRIVVGTVMGLVMVLPNTTAATEASKEDKNTSKQEISADKDQWELQSVRELMHQDLHQALQKEALKAATNLQAGRANSVVGAVLKPQLVALYGVGSALMAEVHVGNRAYLYVRGQTWPAGYAGDSGVYRLRDMNGACVQLEKDDDRHSLCLQMLLSEVQP